MTISPSKQHRYPSSAGQPGSVVWFISFGDLLTLLLCFFLVLTQWDRLKNDSKSQSFQRSSPSLTGAISGGTTLASDLNLKGSVVKLELPIFAKDVDGDDVEVLKLDNIEQELRRVVRDGSRAEILLCSPVEDRAHVVLEVEEMFKRGNGTDVPRKFTVSRSCDNDARLLVPVTERVVGRIRILGM
jgi:flagellar motor protein MotB